MQGRSLLLRGGRVAFAAVAGVLLIVGLPLVVFGTMSDPDGEAAAPQASATGVPATENPSSSSPEAFDMARLEAMGPLPVLIPAGESFVDGIAASSGVVNIAATVPSPDEWVVRVWRSIGHGDTWQEPLALVDEGLNTT